MDLKKLKETYENGGIADEVLNGMYENGIITKSELLEITMTDKKILAMFEANTKKVDGIPKCYKLGDGRYKVRLDGKQIIFKDKKTKDKELLAWYRKNHTDYSFKAVFELFKQRQADCATADSDNTYYYYDKDFERYFGDICDEDIRCFDEDKCCAFLKKTASETDTKNGTGLIYSKFCAVYELLMGILKTAYRKHYIDELPRAEKREFRKFCRRNNSKKDADRIISDDEYAIILKKIQKSIETNPLNMTAWAFLLLIYTGMRRAEITALKWEDVDYDKGCITVQREYVYMRRTKTYQMNEHTKTFKDREIPLTENVTGLLEQVRNIKQNANISSEYVFGLGDKLVTPTQLTNYGRDRTQDRKGGKNNNINPHRVRRTLNSNLRYIQGVSPEVASAILGNSTRVNTGNYTYDTTKMDYKKMVMSKAQSDIIVGTNLVQNGTEN